MLLLVAKLLWEAQGARSMAGILARRCPAWYLCYWASLAAGAEHISSCHTSACLLRHLPRNVTDAPQHPVSSHLGSTCCKTLSSSRGMTCVHMLSRYHRRHFSRQWMPPSWVCCFPPAAGTPFPCLGSGRCSSGAPHCLFACFEGPELNFSDKHNIIVISNRSNRQYFIL